MRSTFTFLIAGAAVAATAFTFGAHEAEAAPRSDMVREMDRPTPVNVKRGPFIALRVNSMDAKGESITLACLDYGCMGLLPGEGPQRYQLVRHGYRRIKVAALQCDEVLNAAFRGKDVAFDAWSLITRWVRRQGPAGTPIGGFAGEFHIRATFGVAHGDALRRVTVPLIDLGIIGTTGMRPGRGEVSDEVNGGPIRCDNPRHDEGYYQGRFNRQGLRKIHTLLGADEPNQFTRVLKTLAHSLIAGTFESRLFAHPEATDDDLYCDLTGQIWWFDGLMAFKCKKPSDVNPRVDETDRPKDFERKAERDEPNLDGAPPSIPDAAK